MRGRMSKAKSYAASLNEGDLIVGGAVGRVINSETSQYKEGDIVEGFTLGWQEYAIATPATIRKINPELAPIQTVCLQFLESVPIAATLRTTLLFHTPPCLTRQSHVSC